MKTIQQWIAQHSISAHTFVAGFGIFTGFLGFNPTARGMFFGFLDRHPFYSLGFAFASFVYARYSGSHSEQGVAAEFIADQKGPWFPPQSK